MTPQLALVVNPTKVDDVDALAAKLAARCRDAGLGDPLVLPTTEDDPGDGRAREAVAAGVGVVVAAGGDGTVRAVAEALAGTDVVLAVLPLGTGNLLARNLDLPLDVEEALDVVVGGVGRRIDLGRLVGADPDRGTVFAVVAGAGFDAAMMREAPEGLKAAVGWPAYLVGGARSLRRQRARVEVFVDDAPPVRARVRTVLVANVGNLQAGLALAPDARPDDGRLDVVLVAPVRVVDWLVVLYRGLTGRAKQDHRLRHLTGREVRVLMHRSQPRQVDGDLIDDGVELHARVEPGALLLRVPGTHEDGPAGEQLAAVRPAGDLA